MTVAYINRLAHRLILWSSYRFLCLRATHVPGTLNVDTDMLSRGTPMYGEWSLHPAVVEQIWARFGQASVDQDQSSIRLRSTLCYRLGP